MKKVIPVLFVVMILATGCPQAEPEVHQVEIGLFTPYTICPDKVNGKVKELVEKNYMGFEKDGVIVKGDRLTVGARDSIKWTRDFRLTFDQNGNLLECATLDENDAITSLDKQTIEDGRIVKNEFYRDDTLRTYSKLTYNEAGHLVGFEQFRVPVDTLAWSAQLLTDEQGNYLEWQLLDAKGDPTSKYIFSVSQEGLRTGYKFYNKEGEMTFEERFSYNDFGCLTEQVTINKEGEESVAEFEYEYDKMRNWVKCIGNDDKYTIVTERKITYFPE